MESLTGVFLSAFLAATILPFSSEIVLTAFYAAGGGEAVTLWLVASAGNVLGAWSTGGWGVICCTGRIANGFLSNPTSWAGPKTGSGVSEHGHSCWPGCRWLAIRSLSSQACSGSMYGCFWCWSPSARPGATPRCCGWRTGSYSQKKNARCGGHRAFL